MASVPESAERPSSTKYAQFDTRDFPDKASRTATQLAQVRKAYGDKAAKSYRGGECDLCGALPGFDHGAGCELADRPEETK